MSRPPRGLSPDEAAAWRKVAATVTPLHPQPTIPTPPPLATSPPPPPANIVKGRIAAPLPVRPAPPPPPPRISNGLDASWDRKLARGSVVPDVTIDLHGMTLDTAHRHLLGGIATGQAMGARIVLVIAGKPRPHTDHDQRGERRGAIRAKLLDWLAHSAIASQIAAVRAASPRHGGSGAVYIVLRKQKIAG